jgi:hypothetical protein
MGRLYSMVGSMMFGLSAIALVACTGTSVIGGGAGGTGSDYLVSGCPDAAPEGGEQCDKEGLFCTYGDAPRAQCRTAVTCSGGSWVLGDSARCINTEPPAGFCPATPPADDTACSSNGAICTYGDGTICECSTCGRGQCQPSPTLPWWTCRAHSPSTCPPTAPNAGTACEEVGQGCYYGLVCGYSGAGMSCGENGAWVWERDPIC